MDIKDINLRSVTGPISKFLHRFHAVLFVIIALGGLAFVIFSLYNIAINSSDVDQTDQRTADVFDQKTIDQLEKLRKADDSSKIKLPNGRINPFVE